jgi:hypothetical protein
MTRAQQPVNKFRTQREKWNTKSERTRRMRTSNLKTGDTITDKSLEAERPAETGGITRFSYVLGDEAGHRRPTTAFGCRSETAR